MKTNTIKYTTLTALLTSTFLFSSCDSDSNSSSLTIDENGETTGDDEGSDTDDDGTLVAGDTFSISYDEVIIEADVLSDTELDYTFNAGGVELNIGVVPYSESIDGETRVISTRPNFLDDDASIVAIQNLIDSNSVLRARLAIEDFSAEDNSFIASTIIQNIDGVVVDLNNGFFLVEEARIELVGSIGTFTESGTRIEFTSDSVSLVDEESSFFENATVVFE